MCFVWGGLLTKQVDKFCRNSSGRVWSGPSIDRNWAISEYGCGGWTTTAGSVRDVRDTCPTRWLLRLSQSPLCLICFFFKSQSSHIQNRDIQNGPVCSVGQIWSAITFDYSVCQTRPKSIGCLRMFLGALRLSHRCRCIVQFYSCIAYVVQCACMRCVGECVCV